MAAVILAAGRSSRMGAPKQLLEIEGKTLLRRTTEMVLASDIGAGRTSVVVGSHGDQCWRQVEDLPCHRISNHNWEDGLSTSVKESLLFWQAFKETHAALFVPCDLPFLSTQHINALLKAYQESGAPLVVSRFAEVLGSPGVFGQELWDEMLRLEGDEGARKIIRRHQDEAIAVEFEGGQFDLDTPQDVEAFRSARHQFM